MFCSVHMNSFACQLDCEGTRSTIVNSGVVGFWAQALVRGLEVPARRLEVLCAGFWNSCVPVGILVRRWLPKHRSSNPNMFHGAGTFLGRRHVLPRAPARRSSGAGLSFLGRRIVIPRAPALVPGAQVAVPIIVSLLVNIWQHPFHYCIKFDSIQIFTKCEWGGL